jgi:hypothetical protein
MSIVWVKRLALSGLAGTREGSLPAVVPCVVVARRRGAQADSLVLVGEGLFLSVSANDRHFLV